MTTSGADIENQLARLEAGVMHANEMLESSRRVMASAQGAQWSQAASYHGQALYALGHLAEAFAMFEQAWQRADALDDPVAGALATRMGGFYSFILYDYAQAEHWCRRELDRRRSRLVASVRRGLTDLLASARVSQGDLGGARELLAEWEGATSHHIFLAYHEGDWERCVILLRKELERARGAGNLLEATEYAAMLGRIARIGNQRVEAEAIFDDALQGAISGPHLMVELFIRLELALINSDFGQFRQARHELQRCKEILDNGEDWRGHHGAYAHICALVNAAEHILKFVSADGRWHVALKRRSTDIPEEAAAGFRTAIEIFRRYHAPWEETAALLYWSQALFAASQIRQSFEKYETAFAIFDRIATRRWNERVQTELFRFVTMDTLAEPLTVGDGAGANVFRKEGDYWTISFHGSMVRLRDSIGMHYIGRLIANPGTDFAAPELVALVHKATEKAGSNRGARSSKSNGRMRREPIARDDAVRERTRLMVTKRIKDVIARIRQSHPELARHFAACIHTGYTCSYVADGEHPEAWLT